MPVDRTIVGHVAQDVMGQLEQRFGDDEDANVRAVFLIAAIDYAVTDSRIPRSAGASAKGFRDTKLLGRWST
jgi:hypothetical protein